MPTAASVVAVPATQVLNGVRAFLYHVLALRIAVVPLFTVGMMLGLPSTLIPDLQSDTFGSSKFLDAGLLGACKGLVSLVVAPLLGVVSDRHGRKRTLFGTCVALAIPPLVMGFTKDFWVFSVLDIFFGAYSGALSVLLATIADIIPAPTAGSSSAEPHGAGSHAHGFSVGMAAFGIGVGVGSGIGVAAGVVTAFRLSALLGMCTSLYVVMVFPEVFLPNAELAAPAVAATMPGDGAPATPSSAYQQHQQGTSSAAAVATTTTTTRHPAVTGPDDDAAAVGANDIYSEAEEARQALVSGGSNSPAPADHHAVNAAADATATASPGGGTCERVFYELVEDSRRVITATTANRNLRTCFLVVLLDSMAEQTMVNLALLYLQEQLNFTDADQLKLIAVLGVSGVICLLIAVPYLTKAVGTVATLQVALVANAVSIGMYAFVTAKWEAITLPLLCMLGAGVFPCTSAIAAATVTAKDEGLAQGVTAGGRMLAEGASPAVLGLLFYAFKHTALPGAPFLVAAMFVIGALLLSKNLRVRADGSVITNSDLSFSDHEE